jgi:PAS domain S-box-containing protein
MKTVVVHPILEKTRRGIVAVILKHSRIAGRILFHTLLYGGICAFLMTAVHSYINYKKDVQRMNSTLESVGFIYSSAIAAGVLYEDSVQLETTLRGAMNLHSLCSIEIMGKIRGQDFHIRTGDTENSERIYKNFPLRFRVPSGEEAFSGTLIVTADPGQLKWQAWKKGLEYFLVMILFVGVFSGGVFVLIRNTYARHLLFLTQHTDLDELDRPLALTRKNVSSANPDELDLLVAAINTMRERLVRNLIRVKEAENELKAAREWFEKAFDASPTMILVFDGKSERCIDVNLRCLQKTEYQKQELLTQTIVDLGLWCDFADHRRFMEVFEHDGTVEELPINIRNKSGKEINCLLTGQKAHFSGTECLLIFLEDLSKRVRAERALQESECRLRDFANTAAYWFWEMDTDLRFTYLTGKVEEVMGMEIGAIIGCTHKEIYHGQVEASDWLANSVKLARREPFGGLEVDWLRPDGKRRRIVLDGKPIFDPEGQYTGYRGAGRDITLRKQAEETMRRSMKMDAVGQVTGGIAHDFNNILGIIIGNLDFVKRFGNADDLILKRVEAAVKASERATKLTRQLLDFSRQQARNCQPTDINRIIQGMDSLIARSVSPEIEVVIDLFPDLWMTDIDRGDFEDVLLNLVINARDAMPQGGRLQITTGNTALDEYYTVMNPGLNPGDYIQLAVSDAGVGIQPEVLERIFEPFYTTKPHGKGTGLGMSMVYAFTQRSRGNVRVYSEPGVGTVVHLYLPRTTEKIQEGTVSTLVMPGLPGGDETILIVDDEVDLLALAADMLMFLGYTTLTAKNGNEAIALLLEKSTSVDLLLTDVVMPGGMNGFELAEQALLLDPNLKVLFTSGYIEKAVPKIGQFSFSPQILFKPYNELDLAIRISEAIHS